MLLFHNVPAKSPYAARNPKPDPSTHTRVIPKRRKEREVLEMDVMEELKKLGLCLCEGVGVMV